MLILLGFSSSTLLSQKILSGNINQPKTHVVTIGADRVTVDDVTGFSAGDTILLIQMQGVQVLLSPYGSIQDKLGEPGMHEFMIINAVNGGNEIVFSRNILKTYDPNGSIQIVRVPYYNSATVAGSALYCDPWNPLTKSGGVLALIVGRRLELAADIDVSARGFAGGKDVIGFGICWNTNTALYGQEYYPQSFNNAGIKGEGVANYTEFDQPLVPNYTKGLGRNWTGGGGGNGRFSGGGGGSNRGAGGQGGVEDCFPALVGGNGGVKADHISLIDRIYMGGGGGASTSLSGLSPAAGNGGGIVIIVTDTIIGNGGKILSNGGTGGTAVANGGSGGGGAGGSIALSLNSYGTGALNFSVTGGNGGDNPGTFGEGGGGGGGLIYLSTDLTPNVTNTLNGGLAGNYPVTSATAGSIGEKRLSFKAILNGFLFNSIRSSVTLDQVDSICSNMMIPKITGTKPVGGTPPYTYLWEKSYDSLFTVPIVLANDVDPTNYTPSVLETNTVWFRRTITDSSIPTQLVDVSKPLKIIVQPFITNNIVGNSDTICFSGDPLLIQQLIPDLIVPTTKSLFFNWQDSTGISTWGTSVGTSKNYDPPAGLTVTSWYRRTVTSGRCVDSTAIVKITVLDTIKNNTILNSPPDICFGMTFEDLLATNAPTLAGGDNSYKFMWESNMNGAGWGTASGVNDTAGYDPVELSQLYPYNEYQYRRVVYSGSNDVCVNTSNTVLLKDFPVITNNSISPLNQTIGYDSIPVSLIGTSPVGGDGTASFQWESMTISQPWDLAIVPNTLQDYNPLNLIDTTWYRRVVSSSACLDTSNVIVVNVHDLIIKNTISFGSGAVEDTICSGSVPAILLGALPDGGSAIPGDYAYKWYSSLTGGPSKSEWSEISGSTGQDYQSVSLTQTTFFKREVSSPASSPTAISESNTVKITVLELISNSITGSDTICFGTAPAELQNNILSGGDGIYRYTWIDSTDVAGWGGGNITGAVSVTYQPPNLLLPAKYRRIVYSGNNDCCIDTSNTVDINIHDLPTVTITNISDTTFCSGVASKVQLKLNFTGSPDYTITYNDGFKDVIDVPFAGNDGLLEISPDTPADVNSYTYTIKKVVDKNSCVATSFTGAKKAFVYKTPVANAGLDGANCGPEYTLTAVPSAGTGTWSWDPLVVVSSQILSPSSVKVTIDSLFTGSNISHKFYWEEANWLCLNRDSVEITFDKRVTSVNAGRDTALYSFDNVMQMTGDQVLDVGTGLWTVVLGNGTFDDDNKGSTIVRNLSKGINTFLWTVMNGMCVNMDQVNVEVFELIIPEGFSPNNDPDNYNNTFIITGLDAPNQEIEMKIVNGAGTEVFTTSNINGGVWQDWDGKNSKGLDLPEGTYYYLLKIKSNTTGQVFKKSGFVILKRY